MFACKLKVSQKEFEKLYSLYFTREIKRSSSIMVAYLKRSFHIQFSFVRCHNYGPNILFS